MSSKFSFKYIFHTLFSQLVKATELKIQGLPRVSHYL